ncbi:Glu-tRNA(Gln) amidotransferase subunit GatE [Candidatus Nanohalobium constans]|uniref:Glutamyl-tRNA(Gln) amidotransferase subunit E n=1 Tax=Candidatus Nanohalobium constans TaxID=2565781 RepID=A0A5Q0UF45_9ARCH|nr:Glu-tRNA(Gln) amidotransferase subunit GatE [Candidatus Nanohalobium constans]QGA80223.1 glutamyl-tRNA(Gln) amidotransferase subunit E [Candidatus Nanohalobium constans]
MNYEELGFKCGVEIHQQLNTETKLFCECPVELEDEAADAHVERFLSAVAGETGEKDEAAEVEAAKSKKFVYNYYRRNNCLVELDEEPPHEIDEEALDTALTFVRMIDGEVPEEIQVMRKMVVDGSNTSGFQRTAMVGLDGEIDVEKGSVAVEDVELEEESAGIHKRKDDEAIYDLNRLGVPLIEVGTDASIKGPEHAKQVAMEIGMLLRSTGKARRGIGTIRQDVNVSIEEGSRVEIKGFQDVKNIDHLIELEVERQKNLVELGNEFDDNLVDEIVGDNVTHHFEDTENHIVSTVLENNGAVYALKLPQMTGKMKQKISGERYVAKELVDYAKTRGVQGILHTDEDLENYGLVEEFGKVAEDFKKNDEDVIAVIAAEESQAKAAAQAVRERAKQIYTGEIPEETRTAEQDFTTSYARPLPGSARMYPETDIPAIRVTEDDIEEIDENLPKTLDEKQEDYSEEIGEELATQIVSSPELPQFEEFKGEYDSRLVANFFTNLKANLEDQGVEIESLEDEELEAIFSALESEEIQKGDLADVISEMEERNPEEAIEEVVSSKTDESEIRETIQEVLEEKADMVEEQGMHAQGPLMGILQQKVDADGATISQILQEELEKRID